MKYLLAVLNSTIGHYLLKDSPQTGTGDLLISVQAIEPLCIPEPEEELNIAITAIVDEILTCNNTEAIQSAEKQIDKLIFETYKLTEEEISFIELVL
jgi:hypothetical protein